MAKITNSRQARKMLDAANGKASVWVLEEYHLPGIVKEAEDMLESRGLAKRYHPGVMVWYHPDGPGCKVYRSQVASTEVALERGKTGWKLISARRCWLWPGDKANLSICVTPLQRWIMHQLIDSLFQLVPKVQESAENAD